ncbi:probable Xaa-Pro dipeptidase (plasmid) [Rhodococcus jostii RHA1]|jgi:Xaa-Pro dipeptidase|uniref:Probable Xaa-Pro dipeptidase n=1 Tax=Rhodococcus jostii (strain RHA1) TaxID=101510 RepID=Q0RVR4_RHOJR|nr:Xaa-Pro peptidase family protein [Rhodococcus jostii]ABH00622.1 probable Xaa-Pro dipeptidase [Rhodococcus jostii RHA1]
MTATTNIDNTVSSTNDAVAVRSNENSTDLHIHFTVSEFEERQRRVREALAQNGLDGLLLSNIEDQYWLCGLDTLGFTIFHAMFIGVNGELTHVTRSADVASIDYSSLCTDVRLWEDGYKSSRAAAVKDMLKSHGLEGRRIGLQLDSHGMLPELYLELREHLDGWCELTDASNILRRLRLKKSPQELTYVRRAGEILTQASLAAIEMTRPGAYEGDIIGEMYRTISASDGGNWNFPFGSGQKALLCRPATGRLTVSHNDQVTFEPGASYRHYNVANMFTVYTGPEIDERHIKMQKACVTALDGVQDALRHGNTVGQVFEAHRSALASCGYEHALLRACGYPMGIRWEPTWMDKPMIVRDDPTVLEEGMVYFTHMILTDRSTGLTASLGETAIITTDRPEIVTPVPRQPIINN